MDLRVYIRDLEKQSRELKDSKATFIAASTAHADMVERIFTDGKATSGAAIGQYDTQNELYIDPKKSPVNVATKGKTGERTFKNGKPHKTGYFASYKAYRAAIGRPTATVNLDLFGRLKQEFENSLTRITNNSFEARLRTSEGEEKATGNQRRFGKIIFGASQAERDAFTRAFTFEIRKIYA